MFCKIQYQDNIQTEEQTTIIHSQQSIMSVKEENKEFLVNPNSPVQILIDYICEKVGIDKNEEFDICDVDTGELLNIKSLDAFTYATTVMKPKQTYVLVLLEKDQYGQIQRYDPILCKQTKLCVDVLYRIKRRSGRKSSASKELRRSLNRRRSSNSADSSDFDQKTMTHSSRSKKEVI
ncbi:hypothetical protein PPYR_06471 [Photinus pyralis]|uniref:Uncharacterized protein n=2 Tax=Photinus pyralis TaxID=7054 RepID=A0A5N4ATN4_PHOPY|nr:uncharacterized protein LOC116167261 [Photinus pyralis]KAB0800732.1 hypothetical protein PPYR_06471 [Photinus pyralis]